MKIDFYILQDTNTNVCVCRLIEKIYKQKHRIYVHTENHATAHQLDGILWTYQDDSFLPHNIYNDAVEPAPPIQIGYDMTPENHRDILINLHTDVPLFYTQFARICEFVANDSSSQEAGRKRYRFYRDAQCEITTHQLS